MPHPERDSLPLFFACPQATTYVRHQVGLPTVSSFPLRSVGPGLQQDALPQAFGAIRRLRTTKYTKHPKAVIKSFPKDQRPKKRPITKPPRSTVAEQENACC